MLHWLWDADERSVDQTKIQNMYSVGYLRNSSNVLYMCPGPRPWLGSD